MTGETPKLYIEHLLASTLSELKLAPFLTQVDLSVPEPKFGDYSTNMALVLAKKAKVPAVDMAGKLVAKIQELNTSDYFEEISEVGGFINFKLSQKYLLKN